MTSIVTRMTCLISLVLLMTSLSTIAQAEGNTIAVLNFEVKDLTLNPTVKAEAERAVMLRPLMEEALVREHGYDIVEIPADTQASADRGVGYLYDKPALVAELGREAGADWVIVGRVHKASFLFVYFKALIIDTKSGKLVSEQVIEVKGPQRKFTAKGIEALGILIDRDIQALISKS